jgi:hypothetical protein
MQKPIPIPGSHLTLLRQVIGGGVLHSDRTYPYDREYWLARRTTAKDSGRPSTTVARVPESTVVGLVERGYLVASPQGQPPNTIAYAVSPLGRQAVEGTLTYEDGQPDLFPQCVETDVNKRKDAIRGGQ